MPRADRSGPIARPDPSRVRRVLVIRHRAGGDLLLATPALHALRVGFPRATIHVLVGRGLGALLEGNPDVDRVIEFDRRSLLSQAGLYVRMARGGYDVVIDMVSTPRSAILCRLTGAPVRAGYEIPGRSAAYTHRVPREPVGPQGPRPRSAALGPLELVSSLGLAARDATLRFAISDRVRGRMDRWLDDAGLGGGRAFVALLPTGSWAAKTWPPDRFAAIADALAADAAVLWTWGPGERDAVESIRARMVAASILAPSTDWQELGAILSRASLWIGNDSGPKHLAVALGVPTVTIFGPTHPGVWHPQVGPHVAVEVEGLSCLHCNAAECPLDGEAFHRCMRDLPAERVLDAARRLMARVQGEPRCVSR